MSRFKTCNHALILMAWCTLIFKSAMAAEPLASEQAVSEFLEILSTSEDPASLKISDTLAETSLTKSDADKASEQLWQMFVKREKAARAEELKSGKVRFGEKEMPFIYKSFGEKPAKGHSLWISMHGGGGAPKAVNDRQWENQKRLYQLNEGIYLVPRAPTDTWDLWHQGHIDPMFTRLIENMVIVEGVDPDRVYIMGYSAGGDGVFQLAPRMADQLAGAAMMAGHPNETQPLGLRNLPFVLQMGGNDSAYNRNRIAREWAVKLEDLQTKDREGYPHFVKIYEGKGHWMDGEDKVAIPWLEKFSRRTNPDRICWLQDNVTHDRFYWLGVNPETTKAGQILVVSKTGQVFDVEKVEGLNQFALVLNDQVVNLDEPLRVMKGEKILFEGKVNRNLGNLMRSFQKRHDRSQISPARLEINL